MRASFYDHPELYDLLFAPELPVVEHYLSLATRAGGAVLELGCGSGRVCAPIALCGIPTVGVDRSPAMLTRAQAYAAELGATVRFIEADMRTLELAEQFALVILPSNSLAHLADLPSLRALFATARRHLAPGARFAFDCVNPDVHAIARPAEERRARGTIVHSEWGELAVDERRDYEAATQITTSLWQLGAPQHRRQQTFVLQLRNFYPRELELLVESSGFELLERFGDFNGAPFTGASPHQVCVCSVKSSGS